MQNLKIKDNVDLESLSVYGIEKADDEYYTAQFEHNGHFICIWISTKERIIEIEVTTDILAIPSIIYKLIKDNLVEEVG